MAGSISDIHLRKRAEDQLLHDALHDGLTGLANRALFAEHLQNTLRHADRVTEGSLFAVLHINIERFHVVNDSLGYSAGDDLLRLVAARIRTLARPGDVVGRIGGDQFAVLSQRHRRRQAKPSASPKTCRPTWPKTPSSTATPSTPRRASASPWAAAASTTPKT
jgi:GGDEF domain-containing protein